MRMSGRAGVCGLATVVAGVAVAAPAGAARQPITGKLSKRGYTVIAVATGGMATSVRAPGGAFRVAPRADSVSLHLRTPGGVYGGPIVIRGEGSRAVVGVRAGAGLGSITIHPTRRFARLARRLPRHWIDRTLVARAVRSVPIGARAFGRVRSRPPRAAVPGDRDRDGVPDPLDIDDDGDLVLDSVDRSGPVRGRAAQASGLIGLAAKLSLDLGQTVNANAGSSAAQIDSALPSAGVLEAAARPGTTMELDCAGDPKASPPRPGLIYCSRGGTGRRGGLMFGFKRFPEDFDPDGDGFGTMTPPPGGDLLHGAASDQIKTGDVVIGHVTSGGADESKCPTPSGKPSASCTSIAQTLEYVFATVPALVSYRDGADPPHSATVSYPVPAPTLNPMGGPGTLGGPGTRGNGFPVATGCKDVVVPCDPAADVMVTLTFWRPQRRPIAGEPCLSSPTPCPWIDIGALAYKITTGQVQSSGPPIHGNCPQNTVFAAPDQPLAPSPLGDGTLVDTRGPPDQPASAANTFTYTANLSRCRASLGIPWSPGQEVGFGFEAGGKGGRDAASQSIAFTLR